MLRVCFVAEECPGRFVTSHNPQRVLFSDRAAEAPRNAEIAQVPQPGQDLDFRAPMLVPKPEPFPSPHSQRPGELQGCEYQGAQGPLGGQVGLCEFPGESWEGALRLQGALLPAHPDGQPCQPGMLQ